MTRFVDNFGYPASRCAAGAVIVSVALSLLAACWTIAGEEKPCLSRLRGMEVPLDAESVRIEPTDPPSMSVQVHGEFTTSGGERVVITPAGLEFAVPEIRRFSSGEVPAPGNYKPFFDNWEPWPGQGVDAPLGLTPRTDEENSLILGALYRHWRAGTIEVRDADGKLFAPGRDYRFNRDWGQVANLGDRLGKPGEGAIVASAEAALPRLDLIQVDTNGKASVKQGQTRLVSPLPPLPDPGHTALAGVFIAPWRIGMNPHYAGNSPEPAGAADYAVTASEILVIRNSPDIEPIGVEYLEQTARKIADGGKVTIAFMGDSITLGAEATHWYDQARSYTESDRTFRGRVVYSLRTCHPEAGIEPVAAFTGGATLNRALDDFHESVAPKNPELVIVAFGANDVAGRVGGPPRTSPGDFREGLRELVHASQSLGAEVLLVSCFPLNPWLGSGAADRQPAYNAILEDIAREENVALAPVYGAFQALESLGIPTYTRLHNWINHPDDVGHQVYADTILSTFRGALERVENDPEAE